MRKPGRAEPSDRFGRLDVRVQLESDDGGLILLHYTGLVERTDAFQTAAEANRATDWEDQYMRFAMTFDTGPSATGGSTRASSEPKDTSSAPTSSSTASTASPKCFGFWDPRSARHVMGCRRGS
jgi:hypothetical protein